VTRHSLPKKSIKTTPGTWLLIFINKIAGEQQDYLFYKPRQNKGWKKKGGRICTDNSN